MIGRAGSQVTILDGDDRHDLAGALRERSQGVVRLPQETYGVDLHAVTDERGRADV